MKTPSERLGDVLREYQELIIDTQHLNPDREYPAFTEAFKHYQRTLPRNKLEERKRLGLPPLPSTAHEYSMTASAIASRAYREKHGTEPRFVSQEELALLRRVAPTPENTEVTQELIDRVAEEARAERIKQELEKDNPPDPQVVQPPKEGESLV